MKTHSGAKKRIRVTGTGKYMRRQSGRGHLKLAKCKKSYRRLKGETTLAKGDRKTIKKQLGR